MILLRKHQHPALDPGRLNPGRRSWLIDDELLFIEHLGSWLDGCGARAKQTRTRAELLRLYRETIAFREWGQIDETQVRVKVKACLEAERA